MHKKRDGKAVQGAQRPVLLGLVKHFLAQLARVAMVHFHCHATPANLLVMKRIL
jgi:hypothetical protein